MPLERPEVPQVRRADHPTLAAAPDANASVFVKGGQSARKGSVALPPPQPHVSTAGWPWQHAAENGRLGGCAVAAADSAGDPHLPAQSPEAEEARGCEGRPACLLRAVGWLGALAAAVSHERPVAGQAGADGHSG